MPEAAQLLYSKSPLFGSCSEIADVKKFCLNLAWPERARSLHRFKTVQVLAGILKANLGE